MTPTEIEQASRDRYNSTGDSFFSSNEILTYLYDACLRLARETNCIERTYTTTTVASTQGYTYPTNTIAIKYVSYNGQRLERISFREDDTVTGFNMATTNTGTPQYFYDWDYSVYLRPVPDAAQTLKLFTYNLPSVLTISSTIEIPVLYHMDMVNHIVSEMSAKDSNFVAARYYKAIFDDMLVKAKAWEKKKKRTSALGAVLNEEDMYRNNLRFV